MNIFKKIAESRIDIFSILACLLIVITLGLFGPIELYITNSREFWFTLTDILPFILSVDFFILLLLLIICICIPRKYSFGFAIIILGVGIATYIQGNFLNIDLGVLDGTEIIWKDYKIHGIINGLCWLFLIVLPFAVAKKIGKEKFRKIGVAICSVIITMQLSTLAILLLTNNSSHSKTQNISLSTEGMFTLSENKNVIIFCLDAFDSKIFNEIISESEEYKNIFEDFTYYPDTTGAYPTTKGALPYLLTGVWYDNSSPYKEYIINAYKQTALYENLASQNYDTRLYTDSLYVSSEQIELIRNLKNIKTIPSSEIGLGSSFLQLVGFRYMPHFLKKNFWIYSGDFNNFKESGDKHFEPYVIDDFEFYSNLTQTGITTQNATNSFRFYHLKGAHPPYSMNEFLAPDKNVTVLQQAKGVLNILKEFLAQLQEKGIYDSSAILILADHGSYDYCQNPVFLFKNFGEDHNFTVDEFPISYENVIPGLLATISDENNETPFSIAEGQNRKFMYYTWDDDWKNEYLPDIREYNVFGNANDPASLKYTRKLYTPNGATHEDFEKLQSGKIYEAQEMRRLFETGIEPIQGEGAIWSTGKEARIYIDVGDNYEQDLKMHLSFDMRITPQQRLIIYVNDSLVEEQIVAQNSCTILIPKHLLDQPISEIRLEYPDATTPYSLGLNDDRRFLSFRYSSIMFESVPAN